MFYVFEPYIVTAHILHYPSHTIPYCNFYDAYSFETVILRNRRFDETD